MKERIAQIIQKEDITAAQFADKIGISHSNLSHILNGRNKPSLEVVMKIHKACDYISLKWLLYGEGEMETDVDSNNTIPFSSSLFDENSLFATDHPALPEYHKGNEEKQASYPTKEVVRQEIKYIEVPAKKITEIRIFFDNGTYETFKPEK
ncbi:helix-turn-helix transcriptional regulator [Phocaeicola sp.]|uniref:helix-turn-helix domain-containing protein n=1 Tax=Phocaeicola sp. TaxID=2773926 RepID=UPI0023C686F3|nr:helix-turn-helix transcriptional regulator [Phocaeicola sp.]MDE5677937.1 helix-turn-helix domain-containing protein [Phocaeicola sp.]